MAGTGQGALQPTKLIQTDDFMETISPPGYQFHKVKLDLSNGGSNLADAVLYCVPDGVTVDIIDAGFTACADVVVDSGDAANVSIGFYGPGTDDDDYYIAGADIPNGLAAKGTASVLRGTGSGSSAWAFETSGSPAVSNALGIESGYIINAKATKQSAASGTCEGFIWIRLKYTKKDNGSI